MRVLFSIGSINSFILTSLPPKVLIVDSLSSNSLVTFPFKGMKYPFNDRYGKDNSANMRRWATALDVIMSKYLDPNSSARPCRHVVSWRFNLFITVSKKEIFLLFESNKVISKLGKKIFKTRPGKPAPVPISKSFKFDFKSISLVIVKES